MSRNTSGGIVRTRPSPLTTKSFTRYEPPVSPVSSAARSRASTISSPVQTRASAELDREDVFHKRTDAEEEDLSPAVARSESLPARFDELPIELVSLCDRFVESLSSKQYSEPPTIEQVSELYQNFYLQASEVIVTHIASLRTKLGREVTPAPAKTSLKPTSVKGRKSADSLKPVDADGSQQMLTVSEVADRRKQRRLLEYKRLVLEEAVEKRACEQTYDRIWAHKSTLDEVNDEKLRSKTAALSLVGIGLRDLGVTIDESNNNTAEDIQEALSSAREELAKMNDKKYPLGKLEHLTAAHKAIVDTLYTMQGSSSSADEILPTFIYTLISCPVEGIRVISNLNFIQRFRTGSKIDGEAAYCLTTLEAAIGFLETVDLASLREDEKLEGPPRSTVAVETPTIEKTEAFPAFEVNDDPTSSTTVTTTVSADGKMSIPKQKPQKSLSKPVASSQHNRTLSDLLKPVKVVQSASEAVRIQANEKIDNISSSLDSSVRLFITRLKEQAASVAGGEEVVPPTTLDQARQLVSKPVSPEIPDDAAISETSSIAEQASSESPQGVNKQATKPSQAEDKLMSLFGGRRSTANTTRDASTDRASIRSNSSAKKVAFTTDTTQARTPSATHVPNPLDAAKSIAGGLGSLGSAFGGALRGFGRPSLGSPPPSSTNVKQDLSSRPLAHIVTGNASKATSPKPPSISKESSVNEVASSPRLAIFVDEPEKVVQKIKSVEPAIQRFVDARSVNELRIGDVAVLLADYQRLAGLLQELAQGQSP